jgi:hypothetical protein
MKLNLTCYVTLKRYTSGLKTKICLNVKLSLSLNKHDATKTHGEIVVELHEFLPLELGG